MRMGADCSDPDAVDRYLASCPPQAHGHLREMRALLRECLPDAVERMSYGIPTYDLQGRHVIHFGGYEQHIGLYPTSTGIAAFAGDLAAYRTGKGTVQFPLGQPLPTDLIRRIAAFRAAEVRARGER